MPTKYRQFQRKFVPQGTPANQLSRDFILENYLSDSRWVVYPGTKRPDLTVQNAFELNRGFVQRAWVTPGIFLSSENAFHSTYAETAPVFFITAEQENQAIARFNGKLRKGSASLGVTLASWRQSRDMIVKRSHDVIDVLDDAYKDLKGSPSRRRRLRREKREPLANEVLEHQFGWKPLFNDFEAALTTVCQDGIPPQWVRAAVKGDVTRSLWSQNSLTRTLWRGTNNVTLAACVRIDNPNLWLLNRMGLINPATVIWDLIPWSFVVNMFVNVNQMISSVTDEVGLQVQDRSTTYSCDLTREEVRLGPAGFTDLHGRDLKDLPVGYSLVKFDHKRRITGSHPKPTWQVKVPNLDWNLAVIATSLLLQKATRLNNLVRGI